MQDKDTMQAENGGAGQPEGINVNKLSKENLKILAQALIDENTEMERQLKSANEKNFQLEKAAQKAKQLSDMYSTLNNDFTNYRKRNAEIEITSKDNAAVETALNFLPVYENLKLAMQNIENQKDKEGVEMIYRQFTEALEQLNIKKIESKGQPFDPNMHIALMAEETQAEKLKGTVKQVFSDGYCYKDKIIKQSQVIVYK